MTKTLSKKPATKKTATKKARKPKSAAVKHPALHGIAKRVRSGNNGPGKPCAKHVLFALFIAGKAPDDAALEAFAKKNGVKASTCRSWMSNWRSGLDKSGKTGSYLPPAANDAAMLKRYNKIVK